MAGCDKPHPDVIGCLRASDKYMQITNISRWKNGYSSPSSIRASNNGLTDDAGPSLLSS